MASDGSRKPVMETFSSPSLCSQRRSSLATKTLFLLLFFLETQQTIQKLRSDKRQRLRMEQRDERREEWGERGKRASIAGIMASFPIDSRQSRRNIIRKRQHNDNC